MHRALSEMIFSWTRRLNEAMRWHRRLKATTAMGKSARQCMVYLRRAALRACEKRTNSLRSDSVLFSHNAKFLSLRYSTSPANVRIPIPIPTAGPSETNWCWRGAFLFQSMLGNFTEYNHIFLDVCLDLMSVGDADFSLPATAFYLVFSDSSLHL